MKAGSISVVLTTLTNENYRRSFPLGKQAVNIRCPFRERITHRNAQGVARSMQLLGAAGQADPVCAEALVDGGPAYTSRGHVKCAADSASPASPRGPGSGGGAQGSFHRNSA